MKKIKLLALFCCLAIALSAFVACDHEDKVTGDETIDTKETTNVNNQETTGPDDTDTPQSSDSEKTDVDFESMSQKELYEYLCDVVLKSSEQNQISVYYRQIEEDEQGGFYCLFVDRTNGWKAYIPPVMAEGGEWYKESNGEYIYYAKDKVLDWGTMEKASYREMLTEEGIDWEVDLFASRIGMCNDEDQDFTGFMHVLNNHDCNVEITETEEKVTIGFTPLEPRLCDICENTYSQFEYYEYTIIDGLISNTTVSYVGGFAVSFDITYQCASFDVPSDEECPLKE